MCFVGNSRCLSVLLNFPFYTFYPLLREQQSKTLKSHPDNVRRTRDKAGLYLLTEMFKTVACRAQHLCGREGQYMQNLYVISVGAL